MAQREYGHGPSIFNNVPKGYNAPPRPVSHNAYMTLEQQAERKIRQIRKEQREDFGGYESQIQTPERPTLGNKELPIDVYKEEIVASIDNNQLTIIVAETGAGKSTQVPQYAAEAGYVVTQTQPRRMAAREVSSRIGDEVAGVWLDTPKDIAAYHTAEKNTRTENTIITNVTDGLLLAQDSGTNGRQVGERDLVIIDEAHEWGMNVEMELAFVRRQMIEYPERRFVIQSATLDSKVLQEFFADTLGGELPPVIEVPGRTFPVEKQEFPEETVMDRALSRAEEMNALDLVQRDPDFNGEVMPTGFMITAPGKREIGDYIDELRDKLPPEIAQTATILPLHSRMSDKEQSMVMREDYPGIKIIVTTNVAKTSLTVPGIAGVVDGGYARHQVLDEGYNESLVLYPTSRADRLQWAGRCGRIAPGWYDLAKMNEDMPYVSMDECADYETPEALRINPISYVLKVAAMGSDFSDWKFVHTPKQEIVTHAKESLKLLGALDDEGKITTIGRRMHEFPLSPVSARMMVEADQFSPDVRAYMAAIVGAQEVGGLPLFTRDNSKRWKDIVQDRDSDLIAQLDIFSKIRHASNETVLGYDLDLKNVERARETFWKTIHRSDGSIDELRPPSQEDCEHIKQCIYAGMPDGIYQYAGEGEYTNLGKHDDKRRKVSNRSVVTGKKSMLAGTRRQIEFYVKGERQTKDILENVTAIDDIRSLGKAALGLIENRPTNEMKLVNGRPQKVLKKVLFGMEMGEEEMVPAEAGIETQAFLIKHAIDNPGVAQQDLRIIKKELERLNHLTYEDIPQLTQDNLIELIKAATPIDLIDPYMIDVNLQMQDIKLSQYVSDAERERIINGSPERLSVGDVEFEVKYHNGKPVVHRYDINDVMKAQGDITLDDGRQVYFVYDRREYTAETLRDLNS